MSLFGRVAWLMVLGLLGFHALTFYFYGHERMVENARAFAVSIAERTVELDRVLAQQPDLLPSISTPAYTLEHTATPPELPTARWNHAEEVEQAVQTRLTELGADPHTLNMVYRGGRLPTFTLTLPSVRGGYITAHARTGAPVPGYVSRAGVVTTLLVLTMVGLLVYLARRATRHLEQFSAAADQVGQISDSTPPLAENIGPRELRRASRAFNAMQTRVQALLRERADMLAGISHDLRTLVTRLSLRLEAIPDTAQRTKAHQDVALITGILDQALAYSADENSDEDRQMLDLASLLESLVSEHDDAGRPLELKIEARPKLCAQPIASARLFANLIDNALKYGGQCRITVCAQSVEIADAGPGIDPEQVERALAPYVRLDSARSQQLPGTGLGLAIAKNICKRHDWHLSFAQTAPGFVVRVGFQAG